MVERVGVAEARKKRALEAELAFPLALWVLVESTAFARAGSLQLFPRSLS